MASPLDSYVPSQETMQNYSPVPESGCWLWLGSVDAHGYGAVRYKSKWVTGAHRLFYTEHVGSIPDGFFVCHKCDTPRCVNPAHLFAATAAENQQDRRRKGRNKLSIPARPTAKTIERECLTCLASFMAASHDVKRGKAKFCSGNCYHSNGMARP